MNKVRMILISYLATAWATGLVWAERAGEPADLQGGQGSSHRRQAGRARLEESAPDADLSRS